MEDRGPHWLFSSIMPHFIVNVFMSVCAHTCVIEHGQYVYNYVSVLCAWSAWRSEVNIGCLSRLLFPGLPWHPGLINLARLARKQPPDLLPQSTLLSSGVITQEFTFVYKCVIYRYISPPLHFSFTKEGNGDRGNVDTCHLPVLGGTHNVGLFWEVPCSCQTRHWSRMTEKKFFSWNLKMLKVRF